MLHKIPCCKCHGTGYLPQFEHIHNGMCFNCEGKGIVEVDDETYNLYLEGLKKAKSKQYILVKRGKVEYYKKEKDIYEKFGRFYCGSYAGYSVKQSYKDEHIVYICTYGENDEFVLKCQIEFAHYLAMFAEKNGLVDLL